MKPVATVTTVKFASPLVPSTSTVDPTMFATTDVVGNNVLIATIVIALSFVSKDNARTNVPKSAKRVNVVSWVNVLKTHAMVIVVPTVRFA